MFALAISINTLSGHTKKLIFILVPLLYWCHISWNRCNNLFFYSCSTCRNLVLLYILSINKCFFPLDAKLVDICLGQKISLVCKGEGLPVGKNLFTDYFYFDVCSCTWLEYLFLQFTPSHVLLCTVNGPSSSDDVLDKPVIYFSIRCFLSIFRRSLQCQCFVWSVFSCVCLNQITYYTN